MGYASTDDGCRLYFETTGTGEPLVFVHEFAGDHRSWEPQLRYFGRRYQCVAFNARGYPPSDVPEHELNYSQAQAWQDILTIIDHFGFDQAHVVGLSMGGFSTLHLGLNRPDRTRSLVVAGCGYGAQKDQQEQFRQEAEAAAASMNEPTLKTFANSYSVGSTRVQFQQKDPRGWEEFRDQLAEHSAMGSALTMRGVQKQRPSLYDLEEEMRQLEPLGQGNPEIQFLVAELTLSSPIYRMGRDKQHAKFWVTDEHGACEVVAWNLKPEDEPKDTFDIAVAPQINDYNGRRSVQLKLIDWRPAKI